MSDPDSWKRFENFCPIDNMGRNLNPVAHPGKAQQVPERIIATLCQPTMCVQTWEKKQTQKKGK